MLGVKKKGTLEEDNEAELLEGRSKTYVSAICTCPLQPHEVWLSYTIVYRPATAYPLSTISLDDEQSKNLHKIVIPILLLRMGHNRHFPRAVVFGSKYSGGLGFTNVKAAQLGAK
eukprot:6967487-Ditylum_brightwellii.AAC.1